MASKSLRATGIRYRGKGWGITLWGPNGKIEYFETLEGPQTKTGLAAAVKRRELLLSRKRLGQPIADEAENSTIFKDVAARWLASLQIDPDSIREYWNILNNSWMPAYGEWPVTAITASDVKERLAAMGVSIKTQKNRLGPLRAVLDHAGLNPNPAAGIKWPKKARGKTKNKRVQRYTPAEREALINRLEKLAEHHRMLAVEKPTQKNKTDAYWSEVSALYFRLLFAFGPRPGEALALCIEDYDGEFIWIDDQFVRGKHKQETKTGEARRVYVPKAFRPHLDNHPAKFTGGPLFRGYQGEQLKDTKRLNPWWKKAHAKERIAYRTPYACRHNRAAELLSQGVGAAEGAYELGHSVQMFLEIYSEFMDEYRAVRDWSRFESAGTRLPDITLTK